MDSAKILLVEDDQTISMGLEFALCQEGYTVTACARISEARQALSSHAFHLAILDINLPDGDGYALCKQIKQASPATSIIFLTVHEEEMSAVMGLELGADDYITKPFRLRELLARVKAVLRRGQS
ncbi:MAG: response regulator transcription factor, partial [Christensenellales bacterium]